MSPTKYRHETNPGARSMRIVLALMALVWFLGQGDIARGATAASHCDPNLPVGQGSNDYRERGDRCEGLFFQRTASDGQTINIVSLTWERIGALDASKPWLLSAPAMAQSDVSIRAETLPESGQFFRMDTLVAHGGTAFSWSTSLLSALAIPPSQLGALAWTEPAGAAASRTLIPLHVLEKGKTAAARTTLLIRIKPTRRLSSLSVQLNEATNEGKFGRVVDRSSAPIPAGAYLESNVSVPFELTTLPTTPRAFITVSARLADVAGVDSALSRTYLFANE